ncbi:thiol:disulfide interchange protein DsbA/DsbL [Streptacidiphilus sp. PB12-B1b]|uniref:thiol:disulfide interchange protein DsbA/DsbL n=1 Tax=Streptacidiphilus sp. PB12-B1b TaxID=2705012 RepID=UPI0015FC1B0A|nr:thiol:disulfide interchange protein DsbA/DsbL [Streptacidiphilus sp. PB12-B1b]QMU75392.1 thiol:disulfide interchange protein DsbA/DsbL [Streptacidiphilus sp. PB12-B1b]
MSAPTGKKPIKQSLLRVCAALTLAAAALALQAPTGRAEAAPRAGVDFVRLPHPVAQAPRQQVVEVFWYGCEHSYQLETPLDDWAARQSPPVHITRIPAAWSNTPVMLAYARLYYTLDRLGAAQQLALPAFHAVLDERRSLTTEDTAADWAAEQGVDPDAFRSAYESAQVQQETEAAPALRESYDVHEMPSVVVGGTYRTSPFLADGGVAGTVPVVDYLYQRARAAAPERQGW